MFRLALSVAAIAAVTVAAFAGGHAEASDVATLTSKTFDGIISKEEVVLVKFFAPWCGHCKSMAEDFSKAATALKGKAVLADVDATIEESLARKYKVEGFPTLKLFMNGEELTDYKGGRDFDSMVKFVENARKPAFDGIATKAEYDNFVEQNKGSSLLLGIGLDGDAMSKLTKASFALRDLFPDTLAFGSVKDSSVASLAGSYASGDFVLLHNDGGKLDEVRYDSEKYASLEAFVKLAALPVFSEFTQENADLYTELSQPIIIGFFESAKVASDPTYAILESLATKKKGNGKVVFVWVDSGKLSSFKDYIGIKDGDIPICSYAFERDVKLRLPASMTLLSERSLEAWVDDVIAGRVEPAIKSESIPEEQSDTGPTVVVGDSWNDIVQDPSTDVLIAQVAPWCGHCKSMKPSLARAADELQTAGVKNVVIGIMDATENDAPAAYKAKGFPTIHFFPASKEAKGEEYEGERNSKAFIDYLVRNAVNKFAFDTSKLGDDPKAKDEEEEEEAEVARDDDHDVDANDEDGEGEEAEENIDEGLAEEAEVEDVEKDEL